MICLFFLSVLLMRLEVYHAMSWSISLVLPDNAAAVESFWFLGKSYH